MQFDCDSTPGIGSGNKDTLQDEKESSNIIQYNNPVKESSKRSRKRIWFLFEKSPCQQEEGLIINFNFQEKKYREL